METEKNEFNSQWDMKTRLAFQVKLSEMMCGGDLDKWTRRFGRIYHDLLEDVPSLKDQVYEKLEANWDAPNNKESPLVREIADQLQSRYDLGNQAEPDEESLARAA